MAESIGRAVLEVTADPEKLIRALSQINKSSDETAKHVKGIEQAVNLHIFEELGKKGIEAVKGIAEGILALGERGAQVNDVAEAFEVLSHRAGSTAEVMLGQLRKGTVGAISDFDLMKMANRALGSGFVKSAEDMGTLAAGARMLAKATGGDASEAFDKFMSVLASGKTKALKTMGIFVDGKKAVEDYAHAHHVSSEELSESGKAAAMGEAALRVLHDRLKTMGPSQADFGEKVAAAKVQLINFKDSIAVAVAQSPVLNAALDAIAQLFVKAFGGDKKALIQSIADVIGKVAIGFMSVGEMGVKVAAFLTDAWYQTKYYFNAFLESVFTGIARIQEGLLSFATFMSKVPGLANQWKPMVAEIQRNVDGAKSLAYGFGQLAEEAGKTGAKAAAGFKKVEDALGTVKKAMIDAQGKAVEAGNKIRTEGPGGDRDDIIQSKIKKRAEEIALAYATLSAEIVAGTKLGLDRRLAEIDVAHAKELENVKKLTENDTAAYAKLAAAVDVKYKQMAASARAGGDEIVHKTQDLVHQVESLTKTGLQKQLANIQYERQRELQSLEYLKANYGAKYTELAALVIAKYEQMKRAATGENQTVEQLAARAGLKSRAELEQTAKVAEETYNRMKASGNYTYGELQKAHENFTKSKQDLDQGWAKFAGERYQEVAGAASSILRSIFGKSKAAAIAATLIDAAVAIVKVFAQYGFPWGIPMAAAIAAQTGAQISKIKSQGSSGFRGGTPGLDFQDFGTVSPELLHGEEAVVPRGKGHVLAAEIAAALPRGGRGDSGGAQLKKLDRIASGIDSLPNAMKRAFRDGLLLARS